MYVTKNGQIQKINDDTYPYWAGLGWGIDQNRDGIVDTTGAQVNLPVVTSLLSTDVTATANTTVDLLTLNLDPGVWQITVSGVVTSAGVTSCDLAFVAGTGAAVFTGPVATTLRSQTAYFPASLTLVATVTGAGTFKLQARSLSTNSTVKALSQGLSLPCTGVVAIRIA